MKVDRSKLKKTPTEAPADCRTLIERLKGCSDEQLLLELQQIKTWNIGKCELYHWVDLLDRFDGILCDAGQTVENMSWMLVCDRPDNSQLKALLLAVLNFTALLIEYSFSRHLYSSIEHLTTLLASCDMQVVLSVLNLLYVFSKRSNYITRLGSDKRTPLLARLQHLAESWGGKENGFGLAECCRDLPMSKYPPSATTLHFEFYAEPGTEVKVERKSSSNTLHYIHIEQLDKISESPSEIMESLTVMYNIPKDKQTLLFTHIRLAHGFSNHKKRLQAVQARLHAISILVYSNALQESANSILYNGLIEELVDVLQITDKQLVDIKAASLRTLTSIVHLERTPKLSNIIDCTGTASYHGFLPVLVRNCIQAMIDWISEHSLPDPLMEPYPHQFATALFSFLYHLASYDAGGEALVSCGMMEALLKVIKFLGDEQDQITFVTRAVRVVDLITNLDMAAFQSHSGLSIFICRLEHEVDLSRKECPFVIKPKIQRPSTAADTEDMDTDMDMSEVFMESSPGPSTSSGARADTDTRAQSSTASTPRAGVQCIPQRAALLKSMLNFLKKAIQDPAFSDGIRHVMDGSLPTSLKHIISNAEYYGPSLFLLATEVVTVFVFQEPSLLSSLQDNGLTDVMLHALLIKDIGSLSLQVPATREVLGSLPNVFSALCLNARGLHSFVQCQPFERLFKVLLSPDYLPAMRRRRSSDPLGDTASNLGSAVDELMRHQPTLKTDATTAIIKLLEEICNLGRAPEYICQKPSIQKADGTVVVASARSNHAAEEASSEDEEEEEALHTFSQPPQGEPESNRQLVHIPSSRGGVCVNRSPLVVGTEERIPIPLMDYILNVMKFVESILSNNTTDDHCQEFVTQKGLLPLVSILGLPNLPIDFPTSPACQAVAGVCKSILTLSHEPKVLQEGLCQLDSILTALEPLHRPIEVPGGSVLLRELANAGHVADATLSARATPLLHALTAAHAYILMFVHTCRVGQSEIRAISVNQWGSQLGLNVLNKLSQLYCSLVWESTVLLSLCTPNSLPPGCEFGQADMQKLVPKDDKPSASSSSSAASTSRRTAEADALAVDPSAQGLLEGMGLDGDALAPMETDEPTAADPKAKSKLTPAMATRIKQIKPLLSASSRLGRALAELFGLLVKLCVGSPVRQRRSHHTTSTGTAPTPAARATASSLTKLLTKGLSWQPPPYTPTPRFRLTFFICSVGFTSPMLFDERKYPYHLMLQKFFCSGGHDALFETFNWALSMGGKVPVSEGLEHMDLPDGTGEFLDAWLMLVEKMVNPSTVLDSPHSLPAKVPGATTTAPQFSALRFLIVTQKAAFNCIRSLWNRKPLKVYGGRMAESMLAILCHILRGEPVIQERLAKEREGTVRPGGDEESTTTTTTSAGTAAAAAAAAAAGGVGGGSSGGSGSSGGTSSSTTAAAPLPTLPSSTGEVGGPPTGTASTATGADEGSSSTPRREPQVNQAQLTQLMDMGFSREHAMEALLNTSTMEQATEYLLTHPPPLLSAAVREFAMSEEDQMMRAIAMSLGQEVSMDQRSDSPEEAARRREEDERRARERAEEEEARCLERIMEAEPLESGELHAFTDTMLPGCFHLLDELPDTVYRLCDLLMTAVKRSGPEYRDLILRQVVNQVWEAADVLIKAAVPLTTSDTKTVSEWTRQMATLPQASNLATRILLLTLLFEELKLSCAWVVESSGVLAVLIKLLEVVQPCLQAAKEQKDIQTPKWITPVLLLIDFYEKMAVSSKRRAQMNKYLQPNGNNWRWFDDRSGRWCSYSASNNSTIDSAWRAGETSVRFTAGRRRYTVQFNTMVQVNEETGNRRPVMLTLQRVPRAPKSSKAASATDTEREEGDRDRAKTEDAQTDAESVSAAVEMALPKDDAEHKDSSSSTATATASAGPTSQDTSSSSSSSSTSDGAIVVQGLTEEMTTVLIRACVSMISVPVDPDTLHATLRLCLRLTRAHQYAMMFAELKSTRMILGLTQSSGFNGFTPLVTLLFRHIIEDPATLRHTMEKVVRSAVTSGAGSTTSGVVSGSLGSREINYILRVLGPAACRNPECFTDTANSCVRIALPAPRGAGTASDDEFENLRIKGPNAVQLVKTTPLKLSPLPFIPDTIKEVIYDMLNALAAYHAPEEAERGEERAPPVPGGQDLCQILQDVGDDVYQQYRLTRQGSDFDSQSAFHINTQVFAADGAVAESSQSGTPQGEASTPEEMREEKKDQEGEKGAASEESRAAKAKASKPLMPTSTILRLLAELVRSYVGIATLIASYSYTAGQSELIKEDCSVLAFVLDHLLPHTQSSEDKDTPALARLFLASLAAAGTGTDAQVSLVNEVKAALSRALAMAEGTEKHARLQAVMCIISTIMESCPSTSSFYSTATSKTQHNGMNNIIRLFLKKGLVNDLARVPHSLDLSSPNMANTVNAALKPLETLSRIVNQPSSLFGGKGGSSKNKTEHDTVGTTRDSNSNTQDQGEVGEAEPAESRHRGQGADTDLMDGEAEGDTVVIAGQPEVLSTQAMQVGSPVVRCMRVENELVDLIDELLERDPGTVNSTIIVGPSGEDESQEDVLMDEAPSNMSQASTLQANREDSMNILEPEDEEHTQEEDSSGSNEDEDSQDEEEEEEEEEEEDQDDEEGDEDDDDEGSEMELDEDFPDINSAPHIRFERFDRDDDLIIEFDNMFSTNADIPPSPGNIPSSHPLMVRHADHGSLTLGGAGSSSRLAQGMGRSQRTLRQLTANTGHTIHVHYPGNRQPNPPLILQRLLGPSAAADILQLSNSLPLQSRGRTRLLVGNEDVHIIARSDDELLDDFFHEQSSTGGQAGTLSSIPTALTRWTDECKVLDAESMHDCVAVVKVPILQHLEGLRDEELEERREKRRRQLAEEEEAKQNERSTSAADDAREQSLQGPGSLGTVNGAGDNTAEGEQAQGGVSSSLDQPRSSEGFLTAPPSGEVTPTTPAPHEQALVSLETAISQQVHQPIRELLLAEPPGDSLSGLGQLPAPDRPGSDAETTQMEMSPAPTIGEGGGGERGGGAMEAVREASLSPDIAESSEPVPVGVSQLEGSPMDTSSPASATQEEPTASSAPANQISQELSGSGDSGLTDRQTDAETGSTSVSSPGETMPRSDSAESQSQAIQEEPLPSTSNDEDDPLAGISLPEGVDPSFLAALPEDIRREVLQNQLGIRPPSRATTSALPSAAMPVLAGGGAGVTEVSPEFLAALPPAIQEEVLAQQRAEQQRRELSQQPPQGDQPLDPVTFIQTLPSELRRSVLEDMEDSVLAVMPPDIAAEAAALRREQEARQRQLMHERLFGHSSSSALSAILRSPAFTSRLGGNRGGQYTRLAVQRGGTFQMGGGANHSRSNVDSLLRLRGRLLLDHEALSCLLVLLFVDEPKLNTSRLHRVLRNLCYHSQTRGWVIRSLLSILQRSSESELCLDSATAASLAAATAASGSSRLDDASGRGSKRALGQGGSSKGGSSSSSSSAQASSMASSSSSSSSSSSLSPSSLELLNRVESRSSSQLSWLSVSMDAALGCRTNIFQIQRASGRKHADRHPQGSSSNSGGGGGMSAGLSGGGGGVGGGAGVSCSAGGGSTVHIHPQAAPVVCRHVLDTLIQLAKVFPSHFTQQRCKDLLAAAAASELDSRLCGTPSSSSSAPGCRSLGNAAAAAASCMPSSGASSHGTLGSGSSAAGATSCSAAGNTAQSLGISTDFWDLLVKLDNMNVSRKGKASMKTVPLGGGGETDGAGLSLEASPLGQLMNMLSHPVIRRSSLLTEKLLRLLSLISIALPDNKATEVPVWHSTPQPHAVTTGATSSSSSSSVTTSALATGASSSMSSSVASAAAAASAIAAAAAAAASAGASSVAVPTPAAVPGGVTSMSTGTGGAAALSALPPPASSIAAAANASSSTTVAIMASGARQKTSLAAAASASAASGSADADSKLASTGLTEKQLQLSVEVLTSHSCSEEGLEDAANILLQLSRGDGHTRDTVLRLLLSGGRHLGYTLCKQIGTLLAELREYNLEQQRRARADAQSPEAAHEDPSLTARLKGKMTSRFDGSESVVIVAAGKRTLGGRELQLPCMSSLTSKTSTQKFFLRVLQVIIQLREDTRRANKKSKQGTQLGSTSLGSASSIQAAVRQLEAEADAIIQMVREGQRARRLQQAPPPTTSSATSSTTTSSSAAATAAAAAAAAAAAVSAAVAATSSSASAGPSAPPAPAPAAAVAPGNPAAVAANATPSAPAGPSAPPPSTATSEVHSASEPPSAQRDDSPMDVDQPSPQDQDGTALGEEASSQAEQEERLPELPLLSEQLLLDELWDMLGECLKELEESHDQHAVLVLQPAVEAFFLVHATERESKPPVRDTRESQLSHIKDEPPPLSPAPLTPATPSSLDPFFSREPSSMHISSNLPPDTQKFLRFAETHRTVLNQILRQSTTHLADGPFAVLVDYIRILDFDVKRKYFRQELERLDEGLRKEDMAVHVRRDHVFEDSYRELHRKSPEDMKNRLYIVFEGEEGQDAGGLLREWYMIISREMFNPMYALFRTSPGDRVTYTINPSSHCNPNHLSYFKFVGRVVAKAVYDNRLLECYFTRSFYKHILGKSVRYTDMESEDYPFFQGLVYLLENDVSTLGYELTFSTEVQEFGVCEVRDLKPNGANIIVTEENKKEYVHLVCQMKMTGAIRKQLAAFLEGFYEIIPKRLISIFTEQELELLISGLPTIDIDDLKANTEYHKYQASSIQIQWFWRALRSFDQADRAKFLQFVTGTSKVPLQGFAALEGMNGIQKFQIHRDDRSTDRLPSAHTCFNQLDLPAYESYEKLRHMLLLAIQECSEGFGLA
ncbi:E3 ubiquitin-protein ligase HUWE1 isoform X4 [Engraulis encrasicolus]|uniref:E3 ubiquitin-protein ligase HUWE1 isoform X4 n=1 Tax=Engraulis encrasicolus TaxID=184585 RepID=UPI002FD1016A